MDVQVQVSPNARFPKMSFKPLGSIKSIYAVSNEISSYSFLHIAGVPRGIVNTTVKVRLLHPDAETERFMRSIRRKPQNGTRFLEWAAEVQKLISSDDE